MKPKVYKISLIVLLTITSVVTHSQEKKEKRNKSKKTQITIPVVNGEAILNSDTKQLELRGEITNTGGTFVIERGFVYSTTQENPTTDDTKIAIENTDDVFNFQLDNLLKDTVYYVRSYAINATGTSYGNTSSVDTSTLSNIKIDLKARIKTYPNPSTNFISLSGIAESKNYVIYNMQGKEMSRGTISNENKIDVRFLANGLYLLKLENLEMVKFIKE